MYGGLSVYTGNAHPTFARDICRALEMPLGAAEAFSGYVDLVQEDGKKAIASPVWTN